MNTAPDHFTFEGRSLREWLLQLVEEEPERRIQAAKVITYQLIAMEYYDEFCLATKAVLRESDFPTAQFVKRLLTLSIWLEQQPPPVSPPISQAEQEWLDEQRKLSETGPKLASEKRYSKRLFTEHRILFPWTGRAEPDENLETSDAIQSVITALDAELLHAAEQIRFMLKDRRLRLKIFKAACLLGSQSMEFYPDLLEGLKLRDLDHYFSRMLGFLLRDVPEKIPEIFALAKGADEQVRENAIIALGHCGKEVISGFPEVEARALSRLPDSPPSEQKAWAWTLGEMTVNPAAITALLAATKPADQAHTIEAIESLGRLGLKAERVVPRLAELLDEFAVQEADQPQCQEYHRVVDALCLFKAEAKAAVPTLTRHIWTKTEEYFDHNDQLLSRKEPNRRVIEVLYLIGAGAKESLPALLEMKNELERRWRDGEEGPGGIAHDDCPKILLEAIAKIGGTV